MVKAKAINPVAWKYLEESTLRGWGFLPFQVKVFQELSNDMSQKSKLFFYCLTQAMFLICVLCTSLLCYRISSLRWYIFSYFFDVDASIMHPIESCECCATIILSIKFFQKLF